MGRLKGAKSARPIHRWSDEEKAYLKEIVFGKSYKEIALLMSGKFNYNFEVRQIQSAIKRYGLTTGRTGYFEKKSIPWNKGIKGYMGANKTSFKKGIIPQNIKPIGSERIDNREGYTKVKIGEPNRWEFKHKVIYEKHHGKVEDGYTVIFLDGDNTNFDIDNLYKVSRHQLLLLNQHKLIYNNKELTRLGREVVNLIIKTREIKKNEKKL